MLLISTRVYADKPTGWWQITTTDWTVYTDLPRDRTQTQLDRLRWFSEALDHYIPPDPQRRSSPLEILLFAKRRDFVRVMRPSHFAAFAQPKLNGTLLVVAPAAETALADNLLHEYVHYHLRSHMRGIPVWFDEGMASLLQHSRFDVEADTVHVHVATGGRQRRNARLSSPGRYLSLDQVLDTRAVQGWSYARLVSFYASAARVAGFFQFAGAAGLPDRKAALLAYFAQPRGSLMAALGVDRSTLGEEFRAFRRQRIDIPPLHIAQTPADYAWAAMTPQAVNRIQAQAAEQSNPRVAIKLYRTNSRQLPQQAQPLLNLSRAYLLNDDLEAAKVSFAQAALLAPEDTDTLLQQAVLDGQGCWLQPRLDCHGQWQTTVDLLRRVLEQDPARLDAIYLLGIAELYRGRSGQALNYLRVVYQYFPWVPRVNYHLGECLRLLGDARAQIYLSHARQWSQSPVWQAAAAVSLEMLSRPTD